MSSSQCEPVERLTEQRDDSTMATSPSPAEPSAKKSRVECLDAALSLPIGAAVASSTATAAPLKPMTTSDVAKENIPSQGVKKLKRRVYQLPLPDCDDDADNAAEEAFYNGDLFKAQMEATLKAMPRLQDIHCIAVDTQYLDRVKGSRRDAINPDAIYTGGSPSYVRTAAVVPFIESTCLDRVGARHRKLDCMVFMRSSATDLYDLMKTIRRGEYCFGVLFSSIVDVSWYEGDDGKLLMTVEFDCESG